MNKKFNDRLHLIITFMKVKEILMRVLMPIPKCAFNIVIRAPINQVIVNAVSVDTYRVMIA